MARTIREIADGMKVDFVRNETLRGLYGLADYDHDSDAAALAAYYDSKFSAVSVETCILYVVAACAALVENMFDWFSADVDEIVNEDRYGRKGWYEKTALKFQFTDGVDYELDINTGEYLTHGDGSELIVTHASASSNNDFGVKLKVAKGEVGSLAPLTTDEKTAFETYINRLKPAGVPVTVISRNADLLALNMVVYYDPLVFTEDLASQKVKESVTAYLQDNIFPGRFVAMEMVDRLQAVAGIDIVEVKGVWVKHEGFVYDDITYNDSYPYIPEPGYMELGDDADQEIELRIRQ